MMKKHLSRIAACACLALAGFAAAPALAHDHYTYGGYDRDDDQGDRYEAYRGRDRRHYDDRGYYDARYAYPDRDYRTTRRCGSGATGTILGAVAGGLLGREVGRGGRYNRRSGTTGLIIGAGAGAFLGREVDRGRCR